MSVKYARIIDGVVVEICDSRALATHHPDLAAAFIVCPEFITQNWSFSAPDNWADPDGLPSQFKKKRAR